MVGAVYTDDLLDRIFSAFASGNKALLRPGDSAGDLRNNFLGPASTR